jgi:hypothetical protein
MKTLHRRAMLLAAPFLASACSVLPERPYQEVLRYALEPRRQGEGWRGKGRRLLLLRTLRAPPALDVRYGARRGEDVVAERHAEAQHSNSKGIGPDTVAARSFS